MTATIRTLAVHDIVQRVHPRPPPGEQEEVALAIGRAIDAALSRYGHEVRLGRRPTVSAMRILAAELLDQELGEGGVELEGSAREKTLDQVRGVLEAYRRSEIFGLARPKTRVITIDGRVGIYAQPDYWDGSARFFEMKSYLAIPPPPEVELQVRLFQLAFPQLEAVLVCLNRHATPVEHRSTTVPPLSDDQRSSVLRLARDLALQFGQEKVLQYVEGPFVHYTLPAEPA